jgi:hypothetical protein
VIDSLTPFPNAMKTARINGAPRSMKIGHYSFAPAEMIERSTVKQSDRHYAALSAQPLLDHNPMRLNRDHGLAFCLSMIFSEIRFPLFGIML